MRVHIACDHAGLELKNLLLDVLGTQGYDVVDHGPASYDDQDDYPTYCLRGAQAVIEDPGSLGIVLGGSGNGEQIAANKGAGVRAALAWSVETAGLARQHNDANVLAIGARMHSADEAVRYVETFLATQFSGADRHQRRIDMLAAYEADGSLPPLA